MTPLETLLLAIGASAGTTAFVVWALRSLGPLVSRLVGGVLKTRAELDADRDRIIAALRDEVVDWQRRMSLAEARATAAEGRASAAEERVAELEAFIDRFLRRLGTTREAIEHGEPWPVPPRRRKPNAQEAAGG